MQRLTHHLRGLLVALAALALTAGVAFAARPSAETGLDRAAEAAGKTVPTVTTEEEPTVPELGDEDGVEDEDEPTADEDDATEPDGGEVVDDEGALDEEAAEDGERPMNHGWYVSEAAKGATPDGYRNHGEYVSEIARGDDGKPVADDETDEVESGEAETQHTTVKARGKDRAEQAKAAKAERTAGRGGK